jgi:molecular chaperone Hsp33
MADHLQSFMFDNTDIRGAIVQLDNSFAQLLKGHHYPDAYRALMSQMVGANVLLTSKLKFEGLISLQARGKEEITLAMAECNEKLEYRGILRGNFSGEHVDNFAELFQGGVLAITIEPKQGQRYQGVVPLEQDSLSGCLADYFELSEQLPSWLYLLPAVDTVRGILLQALPAQVCQDAEQRAEDWSRIVHLASTLKAEELAHLSAEELLHRLYHEEQVRLFEPMPVSFACSCSQERMERALVGLGREELESIIAEQGKLEAQCEFCGVQYVFTKGEIQHLLQGGHS